MLQKKKKTEYISKPLSGVKVDKFGEKCVVKNTEQPASALFVGGVAANRSFSVLDTMWAG